MENETIEVLKKQVASLQKQLSELEAKCEKCPFVLAQAKNAETTRQILIIVLGIVGAVVGFQVIP